VICVRGTPAQAEAAGDRKGAGRASDTQQRQRGMGDDLGGSEVLIPSAMSSLMSTAAAAPSSSNSDVPSGNLAGRKRLFADILGDRTFSVYAREREGLLPCPYQVRANSSARLYAPGPVASLRLADSSKRSTAGAAICNAMPLLKLSGNALTIRLQIGPLWIARACLRRLRTGPFHSRSSRTGRCLLTCRGTTPQSLYILWATRSLASPS
jgi:hypothetical protein